MTDKDYERLKLIEEAIQSFNGKELYQSSLRFFQALDYQSNKTIRLRPNNHEGLIDNFSLSKDTVNKEKALVSHWRQIEFIFQVADSEITRIQSLFDTGEVDRNEYQSFLFFTIQLKEETYKRGDLVKITRELNLPFKMPVIILFNYGNKLTLSIIDRRLHKKDTNKDVLEKVTLIKDIDIANPQRAHKEILKDLSLNELYKKFEFHSFVKLQEAWKVTLNISELNKKFYKELAYWYFWALEEVKFPPDELKDDKSRNPVNVIRLITRLIFVWFLKEKNLIPDDLFNKRELDKVLDYKDKTGSTYYKAILQNLFFATLNTEMNKDVKDKNKISHTFVKRNTGLPHYFRYPSFIKDKNQFATWMDNIPFLNGGLFECLDKRSKEKDVFIDGFSQQIKNETLVKVPDYLFFSEAPRNIDLNKTFHTKNKKYEVSGLIDILSRYKFTIEENTPVEEEVALDPELLGKVFENLLACYEDGDDINTRKLTGSFYTPREIVNYMVDKTLITYLENSTLNEEDEKQPNELNKKLHHLFSYNAEEPQFTDAEKKQLIDTIDSCKILDPACGSGAFPMGILLKLVFILGRLDPNNKRWKQKQLEKAKRDRLLADKMEDYINRDEAIKEIDKRIEDIEKAFDKDNHELDFARKLYLIENCIHGVDKQPVAIQISKLRFFIALIVDQKTENDAEPNRGIRPLPNLETKFVAADTLRYLEKEHATLFTNPEIDVKKSKLKKIRAEYFRVRTTNGKESLRIKDEQLRNELSELLVLNHELQPATAKRISDWNPYDQNSFADFFDTEWMFEMEGGFDVILGNPPYVSANNMSFHDRNYYNASPDYKTLKGKWDLYIAFTERSLRLLNENGVFSFIIPFGFLNQPFAEAIRKFILSNYTMSSIVDLHNNKIFESATVPSCIPVIEKKKSKEHNVSILEFVDNNFDLKYSINVSKYHETNQNMFRTENLDFISGLLEKIKTKGKVQGDNTNLKELNLSSEFISHRLLINFYNFRNSKEINLFDVFDRDILPYAFGVTHFKTTELGTVIKEIEKKLNGLTFHLWREKNNIENGDVTNLNEEIGLLVKYINDNATKYLNDNFKNNDLNIKLTLIGKYYIYKGKGKYYLFPPTYKMSIEQVKIDGTVHQVDRPQSFLNEARLTRIGIAIRFCLLPRRPQNVPLKILALDDMLISMDMDNRLDVVETIMNKYQDEYQLFVFTHDKSFYREIRRKIDDKISDWVVYEFKYLNDNKLSFKSGKTEIEKAQAFLENHEFESCALELRKLGEIIFKNFLEKKESKIFKEKDYVSFGKMIDETRNIITESGLQKFQRSVIELELTDNEMKFISTDDISTVQNDTSISSASKQKIIGARKALFEIAAKTTKENAEALKFVKEVKKIKERILNFGAHPSDEALFKTEMEEAVLLFESLKEVLNKL